MRAFEARITIHAPREKIWAILTDASAYPSWNTTITRIDGKIVKGESLKIWTTIDPKRAFPANVSEMDAPKRMVWSFSAPLGFFKGARTFTLDESQGAVEFHTREEFSGWMSGPITKRMPDLTPSFEAWCSDLKKRAEST